jgi:hypothetical protein
MNDDTLFFDDLDEALIGVCMTWHGDMLVERAIYSGEIIVERLVEANGMTEEEAIDFVDAKLVTEYAGESTPIVMWPAIEEGEDDMGYSNACFV